MVESVQRSFTMNTSSGVTVQVLVFFLVAAAFTTVYITQPVLPVIQDEFARGCENRSHSPYPWSSSASRLANLPFGILADRYPIKPILLAGGTVITATSLVCAATHSIAILIAARFIQGLFIPSLTTCLAAYLAKSLPASRLNVVMGSYVSATVAGGMGGRLLGGWIHPPLHWRYAFVSASVLLITGDDRRFTLASRRERGSASLNCSRPAFIQLLAQRRAYGACLSSHSRAYFVFSSMFNYLPFYLSRPPFFGAYRGHHTHVFGILDRNRHGSAVRETEQSHGKRRNNCDRFFARWPQPLRATLVPSPRCDRGEPCFDVREFFQHARRRHRLAQPAAYLEPRAADSLYVLSYYLGGTAGITACGLSPTPATAGAAPSRAARHRRVAVTLWA